MINRWTLCIVFYLLPSQLISMQTPSPLTTEEIRMFASSKSQQEYIEILEEHPIEPDTATEIAMVVLETNSTLVDGSTLKSFSDNLNNVYTSNYDAYKKQIMPIMLQYYAKRTTNTIPNKIDETKIAIAKSLIQKTRQITSDNQKLHAQWKRNLIVFWSGVSAVVFFDLIIIMQLLNQR